MTPKLPAMEMEELTHAQCEGVLTDEQAVRLEALVAGNTELRREYILYLHVHACAERLAKKHQTLDEMHTAEMDARVAFPPTLQHTAGPAAGYSFPAWSLSYLVATLLFALGILIGSYVHISRPGPNTDLVGPHGLIPREATTESVGRITALADCQWHKEGSGVGGQGAGEQVISDQWPVASDPPSALRPPPFEKNVYLGDRFAVSSGLMEITYDTGAKVILQGPCTYEIDCDRGGYLAVGKLTAKVDKKAEGGRRRAEKADHYQLPTTNYQLFSVRTPTATVTDLGTEFGVEVEESGATRSHVFQGSVEVRSSTSRRLTTSGKSVEVLHAGQSIRVERDRKGVVTVTREPIRSGRFVRHIPNSQSQISKSSGATGSASAGSRAKPVPHLSSEAYAAYVLSLNPVAYYRMERPKDEKDRLVVFDSTPGSHHGVFKSRDTSRAPYTAGRFGDALSFRGASMGDCVVASDIPPAEDYRLTLTAWVRTTNAHPDGHTIAVRWGRPHNEDRRAGVRFGITWTLPLHQWCHLAYVLDGESGKTALRVYMNGQKMRNDPFKSDWLKLSEVCWGIGGTDPALTTRKAVEKWYWQGLIDEVAIFNKVLSPETIERLYLGGTFAAKGGHR